MKKKIIIVVLILSLFLLAGCNNKEKKNTEIVRPHSIEELKKFVSKDEKINIFETNDEDIDVSSAIVKNSDGKEFRYYVLKNNDAAKNFFNYYLSVYSSKKSDGNPETIKENVSYELITNDKYYYLRVDENTLVTVDCKVEDKDAVIELLKTINYFE